MLQINKTLPVIILMVSCYAMGMDTYQELVARVYQLDHELVQLENEFKQLHNVALFEKSNKSDTAESASFLQEDPFKNVPGDSSPTVPDEMGDALHCIIGAEQELRRLEGALGEYEAALVSVAQDDWKGVLQEPLLAQMNKPQLCDDSVLSANDLEKATDILKGDCDGIISSISSKLQNYQASLCNALQDSYSQHVRYLEGYVANFDHDLHEDATRRFAKYLEVQKRCSDLIVRIATLCSSHIDTSKVSVDQYRQVICDTLNKTSSYIESMMQWVSKATDTVVMNTCVSCQKNERSIRVTDDVLKGALIRQQARDVCEHVCSCESVFFNKVTQGYARCLEMLQDSIHNILIQFTVQNDVCDVRIERILARAGVLEDTFVRELSMQLSDVIMCQKKNTQQLVEQLHINTAYMNTRQASCIQDMRGDAAEQFNTLASHKKIQKALLDSAESAESTLQKAIADQQYAFDERLAQLNALTNESQVRVSDAGKALYTHKNQILEYLEKKHNSLMEDMRQSLAKFNCELAILDDAFCAKMSCVQATLVKAVDRAAVKAIFQANDLRSFLFFAIERFAALAGGLDSTTSIVKFNTKVNKKMFPQIFLLRLLYCNCVPLPPPVPV